MIKQPKASDRRRLLMMVSGALIIFFTGFPHVWSIYQPYVMEKAGWSQGQASMCFYLALAAFVFGNIIGGRMQDNGDPKKVVWIGGGIFSAGVLLSAFFIQPSPMLFYITYGVLQGFGQGMVYTTIIATAQKWFADRPGFASGIIVTANGLCGFFMAPVSRFLLSKGGPQAALFLIGMVIAAAWVLSAAFYALPEGISGDDSGNAGEEAKQKQYTSSEMIHTKKFYYLLLTMLFGLLPYFLVSPVSQSHQISLGIPESVAVCAVMFGSVMNAGTRLVLPSLADKIGRISCIKVVLIVAVAVMAVLGIFHSYAVTVAIVLIYGCYGGIMGSFPSVTSSIFGIRHTGENYGYVMLGIVIATLTAPGITGLFLANGHGMHIVFGTGVLFAAAALGCLLLLEREIKSENMKM